MYDKLALTYCISMRTLMHAQHTSSDMLKFSHGLA